MSEKRTMFVGKGMVIGVLAGVLISLLVSAITGDQTVWSYMIPIGIAGGMGIGANRTRGCDHE